MGCLGIYEGTVRLKYPPATSLDSGHLCCTEGQGERKCLEPKSRSLPVNGNQTEEDMETCLLGVSYTMVIQGTYVI